MVTQFYDILIGDGIRNSIVDHSHIVTEGTDICVQSRQDIVTVTIPFPSPVDVEIFIGTETVDQEHVTPGTTATAIDQRISLSGFSSEGRSDHLLPLGPVVVFALDVTGTLIELGLIV